MRQPLVLGVSMIGLLSLVFTVSLFQVLMSGYSWASYVSASIAILGYIALRLLAKYGKTGWEESILFRIERLIGKIRPLDFIRTHSSLNAISPETLDEENLIFQKQIIEDEIRELRINESKVIALEINEKGGKIIEISSNKSLELPSLANEYQYWYSLHKLPPYTNPLWLTGPCSQIREGIVLTRIDGQDQLAVKRSIERARKNNGADGSFVSNIDSEVSFEEASHVLEGLSRGSEYALSFSLVIGSKTPLALDPELFQFEKEKSLPILSVIAARKRAHRAFRLRAVTASDLVPNFHDPYEKGSAILKTKKGFPLYFSPLDERLESLHWLVAGASGSGKSFFTGLILKRLIEAGENISVLFVDHNRSFRRLVRDANGAYLEPDSIEVLMEVTTTLLPLLEPGKMHGIELSDLPFHEKKTAATFLLDSIERHLRYRNSTHPIFIVLDECWNFLRDEPVLVQRAFREYRKLNGAVVAITQSLSDFLSTENGQSIFQNAPVRILLRQGEDLTPIRGHLGFNDVELKLSRQLKQSRGEYSECLIKTPFLSRLGRLYPTSEEHELLRTDNIRQELILESKHGGLRCVK